MINFDKKFTKRYIQLLQSNEKNTIIELILKIFIKNF